MPFTSCWMILWERQCHRVLQTTSQDRLALQPGLQCTDQTKLALKLAVIFLFLPPGAETSACALLPMGGSHWVHLLHRDSW